MQMPVATSIVALVISLLSLVLGCANYFRDRANVKMSSSFHDGYDGGPSVAVSLVNAGRRPIVLRRIEGHDSQGKGSGTYLKHEDGRRGRRMD